MTRQSDVFLEGEADRWLDRNIDHLGAHDPVCDAIDHLGLKFARVLEVGCANGWRLRKMRERYGCEAYGIDPSGAGAAQDPRIMKGTARQYPSIPFVDCIIFGFCLYLADREDLFSIAAEADLHLRAGGHLIIHDFADPFNPFARAYEHRDGIMSYHMRHADLWLSHPWYRRVYKHEGPNDEAVTVLRKDPANAFPVAL